MEVKLTNVERLMLVNQYKILAKLDGEDEDHGYYSKKAEILERGYEWYYSDLFRNESLPKEISDETMDILDMFRQVEAYVEQLSEEERATVNAERLTFKGFDANNDRHYGFMKFIIERDDRYNEFKDRYLNSHTASSLPNYIRMLSVYKERTRGNDHKHLSVDDLKAIQEA